LSESFLFELEDSFFAAVSKFSIQKVARSGIKLSNQTLNCFGANYLWLKFGRRLNE